MAILNKYYAWQSTALSNPINWATDNVCVALVSSSYTPNVVADAYFNVPAADEVSGTNYNPGGQQLANVQVTQANGIAYVSANNPIWAQSASGFGNARYAILYKATGNTANSPLCGYIDFVSDCSNESGSFSIQWVANANSGVVFTQEPDDFAYANLAYAAANSGIANAATANTNALAAYAAANAAANTVATYANGTLVLADADLNFNNTASVNVSVTANGTTQTNVAFSVNSTAVIPVPGGSNTNIQYNANGVLGGSANLTFDDAAGNFVMNCGTGQANINVQTLLLSHDGEARIVISSNVTQPALIQYQSSGAVGGYTGVEHTVQSLVPGVSANGDMVVRSFAGNVILAATTAGKNVVVANSDLDILSGIINFNWGTTANISPSPTTYGSISVSGTSGAYAGIQFTSTPNNTTLMLSTDGSDIQGCYNKATSAWLWYWTAGVLTVGTVPAARISGTVAAATTAGSCTGAAASATVATVANTVNVTTSATASAFLVPFMNTTSAAGNVAHFIDSGFSYNPSTNVLVAATVDATSDRNKKKRIKRIKDHSKIIQGLTGVRFEWKSNGHKSAGLIAQDVEKVLPEAVHTNDEGTKSVNYNAIIGVLVEAVKELQNQVSLLKAK